MKTIESLNQKWWYRLIKVIYILAFIFIAVIAVMSVYSSNAPTYNTDYQVTCNYGNKETFLVFQDKGILITSYDLRDGLASLSDYTKTDLQNACGISQAKIQGILAKFMANNSTTPQVQPLYDISSKTIIEGSSWAALGYSIITLFIIVILFEIIRRVFYYVFLGSIKPLKRE